MVLMVSGQITFNLIYLFSLSLKIEECDLTGILKKWGTSGANFIRKCPGYILSKIKRKKKIIKYIEILQIGSVLLYVYTF